MDETSFRLALSEDAVAAGSPVRGRVTAAGAGAVVVGLYHDDVEVGRVELGEGTGGEFELPTPADGPITFRLDHRSVDWSVRATSGAAQDRAPIRLLPPVVTDPEAWIRQHRDLSSVAAAGPDHRRLIAVVLVLLSPLLLGLAVLASPWIIHAILKDELIRSRLRAFRIEPQGRPVLLGEALPFRVRFTLRRAVRVDRVTVVLRGVEEWSRGIGAERRAELHCFHEQRVTTCENRTLAVAADRREAQVEVAGTLAVPTHLPPTGAGVRWKLEATAELSGWPDPSAEVEIEVLPAIAEPQQETGPVEVHLSDGLMLGHEDTPPRGVDAGTSALVSKLWVGAFASALGLSAVGAVGWWWAGTPSLLLAGLVATLLSAGGLGLQLFR